MTLAIRLEPDLEQRLSALAKRTGRTKSYYVREALLRTLEEIEDYYTALYRLENPPARYLTFEEVEQTLDLAHTDRPKGSKKPRQTGKRRAKARS